MLSGLKDSYFYFHYFYEMFPRIEKKMKNDVKKSVDYMFAFFDGYINALGFDKVHIKEVKKGFFRFLDEVLDFPF